MKIGVLSDTHSLLLPKALFNAFASVDLIIHAGDICDEAVLKELKALAPVRAVQGNMDCPGLKKKLPLRDIINAQDIVIGVCHGHVGASDALSNAKNIFAQDKVDAVIYGHSHQALNERIDGILYFNPGSPNDVVKAKFFSYGVLTVTGKTVKGEIIKC